MSTDEKIPTSGQERRTGMRPWLKVLLAVSLAANLAVAGLAVGAALRWHDGGHPSHRPPSVGSLIFHDLDPDTRRDLRRRAEGEFRSYSARRRAEGDAVIAILMAEPLDLDALADLLRVQADTRHGFHLSVQQAWITQVEAMTPDERKHYATRLQSKLHHHGGWVKHRPAQE
ncbi:periplasmic heavy metal sensor [Phycobacter azelaicus]|uniref:periplasmic heavy metal sensor n=1 Tax=Phycobacter azelaicus TaxID=2668075 RepID=UPI001D011DA6|nr:periplasmic heavy metal sensor [Phycobacter azelaicus]